MSRGEIQGQKCKILLLGQSAVGKTSLFKKFMEESVDRITPTIGVQFKQKNITTKNGNSLKLQLWDTAGTERYRTISPIYYRNVDGVLLVFDLTDRTSFRSIDYWLDELAQKGESAEVVLVGNKSDLTGQRQVSYQQAALKAKQMKIAYIQANSLDLLRTQSVFQKLIELIITSVKKVHKSQQKDDALQETIKLSQFPKKQSKKQKDCC